MAWGVDHLCQHSSVLRFSRDPYPRGKNISCQKCGGTSRLTLAVEEFGGALCFLSVPAGLAAESLLRQAEETKSTGPSIKHTATPLSGLFAVVGRAPACSHPPAEGVAAFH